MDRNVFQNASLALIDEAYSFVTTDETTQQHRKHMDSYWFAKEFRTLRIQSHRQAGHTTLINQLAFDVGGDVGRRYSTLVMAPTLDRAKYTFEPHNLYFSGDDNDREYIMNELGLKYSHEYKDIVRESSSSSTGKALAANQFDSIGFHTRKYLIAQRKAVFELTGKQVGKFDLLIIDGASDIKPDTLDKIYINFMDDVELFVLFQ